MGNQDPIPDKPQPSLQPERDLPDLTKTIREVERINEAVRLLRRGMTHGSGDPQSD